MYTLFKFDILAISLTSPAKGEITMNLEKKIKALHSEAYSEISVIAVEPLTPDNLKKSLEKTLRKVFEALLAIAKEVDTL